MAPYVSAIVLAAGRAVRMGAPKLLLPLGGQTIVEKVVDAALASKANEVIVVVGYRFQEVAAVLTKRPVRLVVNDDYAGGLSTSLKAGIRAANGRAGAFLFLLADQPFLVPELIDRLIETYRAASCLVARPVFKGRPGHPVLFDASLKPELLAIEGDTGAREVAARYRHRLAAVPVADERVLADIDTPADYLKFKQACQFSGPE